MKLTDKQMGIIEDLLIILCPFIFGVGIPLIAAAYICEKLEINFKTDGGIIAFACIIAYTFIWSWVFEKILKYSPWN